MKIKSLLSISGLVSISLMLSAQSINPVSNQTVCVGTAVSAITFSGDSADAVYRWTSSNSSIGLAASGTGNIASFTAINNGNMPVIDTITVTPATPKPGYAYVANAGFNNNWLYVINTSTNTATDSLNVGYGTQGSYIAVSPDGSKLYLTHNFSAGTISVINTSTNSVSDIINLGPFPSGIVVSPDGNKVYVNVGNGIGTVVINAATNAIIDTIKVRPGSTAGVALSPDGSKVYVTGNDSVSVINTATNVVTNVIPMGSSQLVGIAVSPDGSKVYVSCGGTNSFVAVINTATNTVSATISVALDPSGIVVSPEGSKVYVSTGSNSTVTVINTATNTATDTIYVGAYAEGISISPDGSKVYVACNGDGVANVGVLAVINTSANTVTNIIPVGGSPFSLGNFVSGGYVTGAPITFTITVNPIPNAGITGTDTDCGQVSLAATGGTGYAWSGGNSTSSATDTFSSSGTYTVTVTGTGGCSATASQAVTIYPFPAAGITGTASGCGSITLTATGGTGYAWSGGNSTSSATDTFTSSNTYTVTVTGTGGCSATASQAVTVYTAITAGITGVSTGCGSVSLSAVGGTGYTWSGGSSPNTIADTFAISGTYTVTVTGDGGCSGTASRLVTVDTLPNATITPDGSTIFCSGDSVILSANTESGYLWNAGGATAQSITVKQSGSYSVTVTSTNSCTAASNATIVTVNSLPSAIITPSGPTTFCTGDSVVLSANTESSYTWSTNASTQNITVKQSGNYTVTVTDANGCKASSTSLSVTVTSSIVPSITITASPTGPVCAGTTITFHSTVSGQGNAPAYAWRVNGVNTGITSDSASTNQLQNNDIVTCLLTSSAGCANPDTTPSNAITVTVDPVVVPAISLVALPTAVCSGSADTIAATVTNGGNAPVYVWLLNSQPVNNTGATYIIDSLQNSDEVKCILISNAACASPDTVTSNSVSVTVNLLPDATVNPSGTTGFCPGDSVLLSAASGNASYSWNTHANTQNIYARLSGTYTVTVTNINNCSAISSPVNVVAYSQPAVPAITQLHDTLISSAATAYQWYLNDTAISNATNRTLLITHTGTYTVQITDSNGCSNTSAGLNIKTLGIDDVAGGYDVRLFPNPNNGNFILEFTDDVVRDVEITDAIGRMVMTSTKVSRQQNFNDEALPAGIYFMRINQNGEVESLKLSVVR